MSDNRNLNYSFLGQDEFEVSALDVYMDKMLIENLSGYVRNKKKGYRMEFWLVCDNLSP